MNAVEQLLDMKAVLLQDLTEENLFAFSAALLKAPLIIPFVFDPDGFDLDLSDLSQFKQGMMIPWKEPVFRPAAVECDDKKWIPVYAEKSSMPAPYRSSCLTTDGRSAVKLAHEQEDIYGLMLDPEGRFIPIPLFYLDEVIQILDGHKGEIDE